MPDSVLRKKKKGKKRKAKLALLDQAYSGQGGGGSSSSSSGEAAAKKNRQHDEQASVSKKRKKKGKRNQEQSKEDGPAESNRRASLRPAESISMVTEFLHSTLMLGGYTASKSSDLIHSKVKNKVILLENPSIATEGSSQARQEHAKRRRLKDKKENAGVLSSRRKQDVGITNPLKTPCKENSDAASEAGKGQKPKRRQKDHDITYAQFVPLHEMWQSYITQLLHSGESVHHPSNALGRSGDGADGGDLMELSTEKSILKPSWRTLLAEAELHGCKLTVIKSKCPSYVGVTGILVQETANMLKLIADNDGVKLLPKAGSRFSFELHGQLFQLTGEMLIARGKRK